MAKIAVLGFGTVGGGVAEVLRINRASIEKKAGETIALKAILDVHDFPDSPFSGMITRDFSRIENDGEISVVCETIGGATVAYDYTRRLLTSGKSVVTSNKELVAAHGAELMRTARENGVQYLFEASVGGGIPLIHPLIACLTANEITGIAGILNGTTNYILTRMGEESISFNDALREAQERGYAEANPAADIEGTDTKRKISILASLASGVWVPPDSVSTYGITKITAGDIEGAKHEGMKIKLLGTAERKADGTFSCRVAPYRVREKNMLAHTDGVFNAVSVKGNAVNEVLFYGPGAGRMPTASAVVADVIDAVKNKGRRQELLWTEGQGDAQTLTDVADDILRIYGE